MATDPGWYPDPSDPTQARYWSGNAWTERTRALDAPTGPDTPAPAAPTPGTRLDSDQPTTTPTGEQPGRSWRRPLTWGTAIVTTVVLVAAAVLVITSSDDAGAEVILEPTDDTGTDPFMDSIATAEVELAGGDITDVTGDDTTVESVTGSAPGLYGGTGDEAVCDAETMAAFLDDNPDKATAWADAARIDPADINDHIAELTPVLLREDTRVTNHGFTANTANPFQAVLQAGTAVMVDNTGVPRVRCACGNPLGEPLSPTTSIDFTGDQWDTFTPDRLIAVSPGDQVDTFEIIDIDTGEPTTIPTGSGTGTGELELRQDGLGVVAFGTPRRRDRGRPRRDSRPPVARRRRLLR